MKASHPTYVIIPVKANLQNKKRRRESEQGRRVLRVEGKEEEKREHTKQRG